MKKIFSYALIGILLAGCGNLDQSKGSTSSVQLPESVDVTFNALLPENHPSGETVLFTLLDEVTGLDFNPQRSEMHDSGENSVSISISVPAGTLVKYRYTRVSAGGNVDEIGANGEGIAYRVYLVDGPGHVAHDMVAAWPDLPVSVETGQVAGTITESGSGTPLANLIVVAAGQQTRTDTDGHFFIPGLPQGLHNIVVLSPSGSHQPFQQGALVAANNETPANISLNPSQTINVTFLVKPPSENPSGAPIFLVGSLDALTSRPVLAAQGDGRYAVSLQLPLGMDIRYKYTLGDGFWNAEHTESGSFQLRQLIIPLGTTSLVIEDEAESWATGSSAPIQFNLSAPDAGSLLYIQFKLLDWTSPLPMWPLGGGSWTYTLYSPTNFAAALEYRYCLDAACSVLEASPGHPRSVAGNKDELQTVNDQVESWQGQ